MRQWRASSGRAKWQRLKQPQVRELNAHTGVEHSHAHMRETGCFWWCKGELPLLFAGRAEVADERWAMCAADAEQETTALELSIQARSIYFFV